MKRILISLALLAQALLASAAQWTDGVWELKYENSRLDISHNGKLLFPDVYASVSYNVVGSDTESTIRSGAGAEEFSEHVSDEFGEGTAYCLRWTDGTAVMTQRFGIYPGLPYMITDVEISAADEASMLETRHMLAFAIGKSVSPLPGVDQRALWVPFDNEHNTPWQCNKFGASWKYNESGVEIDTSSEVTALFDPTTREGIVIGSVDHDKWKSGITVDTRNGGRIAKLEALSGWTDYWLTKDIIPHGKVKGRSVRSARFMAGYFDDWRIGLETFGDANNLVAPRPVWESGNPIGWSSWGCMMEHVNYDGVMESAQFMHDTLKPLGFHDNDGRITISLDSFGDNVGTANLYNMGNKYFKETYQDRKETKEGLNMILGSYGGMVVWDWTLGSKVPGTGLNGARDYTWGDATLKVNGDTYGFNGTHALAIDPTHPAVRANLEYEFAKWSRNNVHYVKMDFMNSAIHEGDKWYDPEVTTGVMAYNYGMKIVRELAEKYDMYIVLAMSPIFPYQYAHGRRTCCDRWGRLGESEFAMNAISYGWWTDRLYTVNDPDQMVMCQNGHNMSETLGENRVRATSGMASGAFIFGDNFSEKCVYTDTKNGHVKGNPVGYPEESRKRAVEIMGNADINAYVRSSTGSFRPVEGDDPSTSQKSEWKFVRDTPQYLYVAVFNWRQMLGRSGMIEYSRLGIDTDNVGAVRELWTGTDMEAGHEGLEFDVSAGDVRVYRITKLDYTGEVGEISGDLTGDVLAAAVSGGICRVAASKEIAEVRVFGVDGRLIASSEVADAAAEFAAPAAYGVCAVVCRFADGEVRTVKVIVSK